MGRAAVSEDKTRILTPAEAARLAAMAEPADDRTRVLSADEAARILGGPKAEPRPQAAPEDREPQFVDDKIVFFCGNGHRIVVARSLAGKRGKCSKRGCGVPVVIPAPPGMEVPHEPAPAAAFSGGDAPPVDPAAAPAAETAVELDAPATQAAEPKAGAGADEPGLDFDAGGPAAAGDPAVDFGDGSEAAAHGWSIDIDAIENPTARLMARLWLERAHGGVVEVHLAGGSVIMPDFFDPGWSSGTHALFATPGPGETVTLTAVAWDQIQKVVVRQVQGKPDGMFEG